jgi:hypothetical protein
MTQPSSGPVGQSGRDWLDDLWPGDDDQPGPGAPRAGIKAGDRVSAQITQGSTGNVAVAIADPAQLPAGASLP